MLLRHTSRKKCQLTQASSPTLNNCNIMLSNCPCALRSPSLICIPCSSVPCLGCNPSPQSRAVHFPKDHKIGPSGCQRQRACSVAPLPPSFFTFSFLFPAASICQLKPPFFCSYVCASTFDTSSPHTQMQLGAGLFRCPSSQQQSRNNRNHLICFGQPFCVAERGAGRLRLG